MPSFPPKSESGRIINIDCSYYYTIIYNYMDEEDSSKISWLVECCFTSTETIGLLGMGSQDSHLNFHTVPEL